MKIAINVDYGGFGFSDELVSEFKQRFGVSLFNESVDCRTDDRVISLIEEMGHRANDRFSKIAICEIPDESTDWEIHDYDGYEGIIYVLDGKLHHA